MVTDSTRWLKTAIPSLLVSCVLSAQAVEPGDLIINEVYFNNRGMAKGHYQAVELLVVKDQADLNPLLISDRDFWQFEAEDQGILQDLGQGFLNSVPSGTLIVIYNGIGTDDTDAKDFVMRFYTKSSLFCNLAPTTNAFRFNPASDNVHLVQEKTQIDFVKFRSTDRARTGPSDPGALNWEKGNQGYVDVGITDENTGIKFVGDKPDMNDFLATWQTYPETYLEQNNLGEPNGGRNTKWIESLRKKSAGIKAPESAEEKKEQEPTKPTP